MTLTHKLLYAIAALWLAAPPAHAQDYPSRSITLVVPYAAGGGNDAMARIVADHMSKTLGQQIVIENRGGAGGTIATRAVAKSAPDGYTLVLGGTGTLAINPTLYANVGYDPRKDFAPVGLIATSALVVLVHPGGGGAIDRGADRARPEAARQAQLCVRRPGQRHPSGDRAVLEHGRHQADPYRLPRQRAGAQRSHRRPRRHLFQLAAARGRHRRRGQGAGARRHGAAALARVPGPADRGRSRPARLRGRAALRHRRAGRHAAARSSISSTRRCARRSPRRRRGPAHRPAPSRCPARRRNTPPTSIARRPSGRAS